MINILYVCCNFTYGGVEQYILNTIDNINRNNFCIDVLLPSGRAYDREADLIARHVNVIKYSCENILNKCVEFYKIVKNKEYDIIHFHTGHESALLTLVCALAGHRKVVVHAHTTLTGDENTAFIHGLLKRVIYFVSDFVYGAYAHCLACSAEAAKFMFGKFAKHAHIMENGIDLQRFWNDRTRQGDMICINARFDMQKNPYFVVDVMEELLKIKPNVSLIWIGIGPLMEQIQKKITAAGLDDKITLLGARNDVAQLLFKSDWFFLPSLCEGLGIVLIEAQAAGLQCFISDAVPSKADCGGCIVIPLEYTAKQWAEIMCKKMENGSHTQIDKEKVKSFSIVETTKKLETFYTTLFNK